MIHILSSWFKSLSAHTHTWIATIFGWECSWLGASQLQGKELMSCSQQLCQPISFATRGLNMETLILMFQFLEFYHPSGFKTQTIPGSCESSAKTVAGQSNSFWFEDD